MGVPPLADGNPEAAALTLDSTAHEPRFQFQVAVAVVALLAIAASLLLGAFGPAGATVGGFPWRTLPLLVALLLGGTPLVIGVVRRLFAGEFSADALAAISIITSIVLGEYLAGVIVVLMLAGGQALESFAARRASSALNALARRMPTVAHQRGEGGLRDIPIGAVAVGDELVVLPHETCPVDGVVLEGRSTMNEAYLTGEPYFQEKIPGAAVLSGAINGEGALVLRAATTAVDSRYTQIMGVMREAEQRRPRLRRLGDRLGMWYTPLALVVAITAAVASGDPVRFLAVLVVATPCPLIIAIPVAIIGAVSLAARKGIIVRDPSVLEEIDTCRTAIFDKTGTLTYGEPRVSEVLALGGNARDRVLARVASVERYSRHPLAAAIHRAADDAKLAIDPATAVNERPGHGLQGTVDGVLVEVTSRKALAGRVDATALPETGGGLESVVLFDGALAALIRFRDEVRTEGGAFVQHLEPRHGFDRVLLVSGDRESEVRHLAQQVGITEVFASQSPEQKLAIVRAETARAPTLFMGDGINDAPALAAATVGVAFGQGSDVTAEAAGAVVLDSSLARVDELLHIGRRMRAIALQSAVGGIALSIVGMGAAALGYLPPVAGALLQEAIDVLAVLNALRASFAPGVLADFEGAAEALAERSVAPPRGGG